MFLIRAESRSFPCRRLSVYLRNISLTCCYHTLLLQVRSTVYQSQFYIKILEISKSLFLRYYEPQQTKKDFLRVWFALLLCPITERLTRKCRSYSFGTEAVISLQTLPRALVAVICHRYVQQCRKIYVAFGLHRYVIQ